MPHYFIICGIYKYGRITEYTLLADNYWEALEECVNLDLSHAFNYVYVVDTYTGEVVAGTRS